MKKTILILLTMVLLLTACGKKAEEPSESEPTPTESETMPSESESDTEEATEPTTQDDWYTEMYDERDVVYAKELTPVKRVENPTYKIAGYYSTPSEAFAGYPIIHGHGNLTEKPWDEDSCAVGIFKAIELIFDEDFFPMDVYEDYATDGNGVQYRTEEERKYIDFLSSDSVIFKNDAKFTSAFVYEADETVGVLIELLAETNGERITNIDYYITKVFAYGKLIDISEYLTLSSYLHMFGKILHFQNDGVYIEMYGDGRLKVTKDEVSFTEGYWDYFYDEIGTMVRAYDEYGQEVDLGFHPGKRPDDWFTNPIYPLEITLPYWD